MNDRIVDILGRGMAAGGSRRALLAALGVAGVAAAAPTAPEAEARNRRKRRCFGACPNRRKPAIWLRALHAAPMVGAVDLYVNGGIIASDVSFAGSTPLLPVAVGDVQLQVTPAGAPLSEAVLEVVYRNLLPCRAYEIAVGNLPSGGGMAPGVDAFEFEIDVERTEPAAFGRLSAIHLSPDAPAVDVWNVTGGMATRVFANLAFGQQSDDVELPAGAYDLEVRLAGTATVALAIPNLPVTARVDTQAHVIGLAGGMAPATALQALPLNAPATCDEG